MSFNFKTGDPKSILLMVAISAGLVLLGDHLVLQRRPNGPTPELTITGDSNAYFQMSQGHFPPEADLLRFRVLVPWVASLLPFSTTTSFLIISYLSLFLCYLLALLTCSKMELPWLASFLGLFAVYTNAWHLYNYHNPYLPDPFALMALFVLFFSLIHRFYLPFFVMSVLGVLARETVLFLVPAWVVTKQWRKSGWVLLAGFAAWLLPRMAFVSSLVWLHMHLVKAPGSGFDHLRQARHLISFLGPIFLSWGFLWVLSILGFFFIPKKWFLPCLASFTLLFVGTFLICFLTPEPDIGRYFMVLSPVMVVGCSYLFSVLLKAAPRITWLLVGVLCLQLLTGMPTVITPREGWVFRAAHYHEGLAQLSLSPWTSLSQIVATYWPRMLPLALGTLISLWIAFLLRRRRLISVQSST